MTTLTAIRNWDDVELNTIIFHITTNFVGETIKIPCTLVQEDDILYTVSNDGHMIPVDMDYPDGFYIEETSKAF